MSCEAGLLQFSSCNGGRRAYNHSHTNTTQERNMKHEFDWAGLGMLVMCIITVAGLIAMVATIASPLTR